MCIFVFGVFVNVLVYSYFEGKFFSFISVVGKCNLNFDDWEFYYGGGIG